MTVAWGTSSWSSSSRFATSSRSTSDAGHVAARPARLATRPSPTGSPPGSEDHWNRRGRRLGRKRRRRAAVRRNHGHPAGGQNRPPCAAADRICPPPSGTRSRRSCPRHSRSRCRARRNAPIRCSRNSKATGPSRNADHRHCRLLPARRERPCRRRTAEERDKLAPSHVRPQAQETAS